jgi:hypothetical protein
MLIAGAFYSSFACSALVWSRMRQNSVSAIDVLEAQEIKETGNEKG